MLLSANINSWLIIKFLGNAAKSSFNSHIPLYSTITRSAYVFFTRAVRFSTFGCHPESASFDWASADPDKAVSFDKKFTADFIEDALKKLENEEEYGLVLRAKGIVAAEGDKFIHFDYIPGEPDVRFGTPDIIGRICIIGTKLNEKALCELFGV